MDISKASLFVGAAGLTSLGMTLGSLLSSKAITHTEQHSLQDARVVLMAPAPDNKAELAYRRNGFGDRIMNNKRREILSGCYNDYMKKNGIDAASGESTTSGELDISRFEGKLTYVFHIGENGEKLSHELTESEISDSTFINCVDSALQDLRFLPPPLGINRYLAHEFTFKSEQTFKRELEERKNQEPLVLVTPTPQK